VFHEIVPLFWDNKRVPCKWLNSFADKISPKLKSELSPCLGCRLPEKLSFFISGKVKGIFYLATSPASALNLRF
jgi:hypothetical protein